MIQPWENVDRFEEIIAEYAGSKYGVATDSCSNSIFLCLKYLQTKTKLDSSVEIDVPKYTYPSIPMAVRHAGHKVNFVDYKWSGTYKLLPLNLTDGAVRFKKNMYTGGFHCLSFHIKKHIPIGRGGMILTDDKHARDWLRQARYDGRTSIFFNEIKDIKICGWHMFMTPDQAARGIELFYSLSEPNQDLATWQDYKHDLSQFSCFKV